MAQHQRVNDTSQDGGTQAQRVDPRDTEESRAYDLRTFAYCDGTLHILYRERDFTDVRFICEDGSNVEAHKFILAARSELHRRARPFNVSRACRYFKDYLYRRGDDLEENCKIKTYNFSATKIVLDLILEYLYTGQIMVFENNGGVIEEHTDKLWTSVLRQALEKKLGGLDYYMRALLVRCRTTEHHVAASLLCFARQHNLNDVTQAMINMLLALPFTEDCLKKMPEEAIEVVLDIVPFRVEESLICKALAQWSQADSMDDDDELGGPKLPPNILERINLEFISPADLLDIVEPLGILDDATMSDAYQMHATQEHPHDGEPASINTTRGARYEWHTANSSPLPDEETARAEVLRWQRYTTFNRNHPDGYQGLVANGRDLNAITE